MACLIYLLALEYEMSRKAIDLTPFFSSSIPNIQHHEVKDWASDLMKEREQFREDMKDTT